MPAAPRRPSRALVAAIAALAVATGAAGCMPPQWGANAILHPYRRPLTGKPPLPYEDLTVTSDGLVLRGWRIRTPRPRRGLIVYLHGIGDNRESSRGVVSRFVPRGFDVVAFDARGHGSSDGNVCTYGVHEKVDLHRILDALGEPRVILFGVSLGAAIALQEAADDPRVVGVVSISTFSDLRAVAHDRAPFIASEANIRDAFALAEAQGHFRVDDASPVAAAPRIRVPVLLVHGAADPDTKPAHSQRVLAALGGPKRLVLVPGAKHNDVLSGEGVWETIAEWIEGVAGAASRPPR